MDQSCHFLPKMAPFRRCSSYLNSPQFLQGRPFAQDMHFISELPERTDDGEKAVPFLKTLEKVHEPPGPKMSRQQMYEFLLGQRGALCAGCDPTFDDPRYLELDHNTPRSDGGINHISNRILLCGPCNRLKSNTYTLSGLRRQNKKLGHMANQGVHQVRKRTQNHKNS